MDNVEVIINTLRNAGYECYMVGGCVRDKILGLEPHDIDFATNAKPEIVEELFDKTIPTGKKFGTITVLIQGIPYEITTYRKDLDYSDNRRPTAISFSKSIQEDLARRDFTINAIAFDATNKEYIDIYAGVQDLNNKTLRCVGNPDERFTEDALRIIRGLRFALKYSLEIETKTFESMNKHMNLLNNISKERIQSELMKIMEIKVDDFRRYQILDNLLCTIIPEFSEIKGFDQETPWHEYDVLNHSYRVMVEIDKPLLKLAALFHDIAKPRCKIKKENQDYYHFYGHDEVGAKMTKDIMSNLKFSNDDISYVYDIIINHQTQFSKTFKTFNKLIKNTGRDIDFIYDLVNFINADDIRDDEVIKLKIKNELKSDGYLKYEDVYNNLEEYKQQLNNPLVNITKKNLAINGNDLINLGMKQGKEIGIFLNKIEDLLINEELINEREMLLMYAKSKIKS